MKGRLPETRNSHLAGVQERKRAKRRLAKLKKAQRKEAGTMSSSNPTLNGTKSNGAFPAPHAQSGGHGSPPRLSGHRRPEGLRRGRRLPSDDRDMLIGALGRLGHERVLSDIARLRPDGTRHANQSLLRALRDPDHRYSSTNLNLLRRVANLYRTGGQAALPLNRQPPPPVPHHPSPAPVHAAPPAPPPQAIAPPLDMQAFAQTIAQTVGQSVAMAVSAAMAGFQQNTPPQLPAPKADDEDQEFVMPKAKSFKDLPTLGKVRVIQSMHRRYGIQIQKQSGCSTGEGRSTAWNISYETFKRDTGIDISARCSEANDRSGVRFMPIEYMTDDELVRFWEVVRRIWETPSEE